MNDGHQRRIQRGKHASTHTFEAGSIYIRDFSEDYRADLRGVFDFMLVEMSKVDPLVKTLSPLI